MKNKKIDLSRLKLAKDTITKLSSLDQIKINGGEDNNTASAAGKFCNASVTKFVTLINCVSYACLHSQKLTCQNC